MTPFYQAIGLTGSVYPFPKTQDELHLAWAKLREKETKKNSDREICSEVGCEKELYPMNKSGFCRRHVRRRR